MSLCTKLGTCYLSNGRGAQHLRAWCAPVITNNRAVYIYIALCYQPIYRI